MALRVLHIIDSLIQGGAEALVKDLLPRMKLRGVNVSVAVLVELESAFERELRDEGIPFLPTAPGGIYSPRHVVSLMRQLDEFDLVHSHLFPAQLFAPLAAMLAGKLAAASCYGAHDTTSPTEEMALSVGALDVQSLCGSGVCKRGDCCQPAGMDSQSFRENSSHPQRN